MRHRRHGFTLIELLVVIAIIAILAAILFPVFGRARDSAVRSECLSNLRQLAGACHMYADVFNDRYPPARIGCWPWGSFDDAKYAFRPLEAYVKTPEVFFCPAGVDPNLEMRDHRKRWAPQPGEYQGYYAGYCYWAGYVDDGLGLTDRMVATRAGYKPGTLLISDIIVTDWDGKPYPKNNHNANDNVGGNLLYNDGHAKWKNFKEMTLFAKTGGHSNVPKIAFWW